MGLLGTVNRFFVPVIQLNVMKREERTEARFNLK